MGTKAIQVKRTTITAKIAKQVSKYMLSVFGIKQNKQNKGYRRNDFR